MKTTPAHQYPKTFWIKHQLVSKKVKFAAYDYKITLWIGGPILWSEFFLKFADLEIIDDFQTRTQKFLVNLSKQYLTVNIFSN